MMDIRLGDIVTAAAFIGTGVSFILTMRMTIDKLATRQDNLEKLVATVITDLNLKMVQLSNTITSMARYDERIRYLRRDVEELRRRDGYISNPRHVRDNDDDEKPDEN